MVGGSIASGTASSSNANANASHQSQGPTGREWAIESLIDRDPEGCFYRATRAIDDAVPAALSSRPNLISRGALVDQAFSLSLYDIDTVEKYDEAYSVDNVSKHGRAATKSESNNDDNSHTNLKLVDSLSKERILNYQSKIIAEKWSKNTNVAPSENLNKFGKNNILTPTNTNNAASMTVGSTNIGLGPSSKVISALRCVYEEPLVPTSESPVDPSFANSSQFCLLLQSIATHPIFFSLLSNTDRPADESDSSDSSPKELKNYEAKLEQMFVYLAKYHDKEKEDFFHGVLLLLLSIMTAKQQQSSIPLFARVEDVKRGDKKRSSTASSEDVEEIAHSDFSLQVGALLALLPIKQGEEEKSQKVSDQVELCPNTEEDDNFYLKTSLLAYFAEAAAVFEERLEIKKARMLARVSTPEHARTKRPGTPPPTLIFSDQAIQSQRTTTSSGDGADRVRNDTVDTVLGEAFQKIVAALGEDPNTDDNKSDGDNDRSVNNNNADVVDIEDGGSEESEEEDDEDDVSVTLRSIRDGIRVGEEEDSADDGFQRPQPEQSDDDDVVAKDESSSSASSSSSDSSIDEDENGESENGMESDEEDEAVLRQALAMSMVDQEEKDEDDNDATAIVTSEVVAETAGVEGERESEANVVTGEGRNPIARTETPVSMTSLDEHHATGEYRVIDEDDSDLPEFPTPPISQNLRLCESARIRTKTFADDPDVPTLAPVSVDLELDPSAMEQFSSVPTPYVILHLLRYAGQFVAHKRHSKSTSKRQGSSFFPNISTADGDESNVKARSQAAINAKGNMSFQLLLATFLLFHDKRNNAVEKLRDALTKQQQAAQGEGVHAPDDAGADEEDDPALNFALNFVEDDTPLSSESLENKGMRRKAAAAAHDNAALLSSLRRETDTYMRKVELYSHCLLHAMMMTRDFLQTTVRQSFSTDSRRARQPVSASVFDSVHERLIRKVGLAIDSLAFPFTSTTFAVSFDFAEKQNSRIFKDCHLYKESVLLWGECFPFLYKTVSSQSGALMELITKCTTGSCIISKKAPSVPTELTSLPDSQEDTHIHKLQVLCRRLRTTDVLSLFVPKPFMLIDIGACEIDREKTLECPELPSKLVKKLSVSIPLLNEGQKSVMQFFFALCHRIHTSALLYDGFYAVSELETGDSPMSLASSKLLSAGETIHVGSAPSPSLYFDATKCSDSIAIFSTSDLASGNISGPSVHQRASKVWGTVLSNQHYLPKTGTHRWAVRLDKCERGHVFIGVATAQAGMRTYVGGDKYGWGMIGTQALWHDRRKIRGDFGATFRTGSTIIVTLDSDAGTLSFSCWRQSTTATQFSPEQSVQSVLTPRNSSPNGSVMEEWGIAFEGLPLDSRLYPAVGLYQRDDRVTLLPVDSHGGTFGSGGFIAASGGETFYPRFSDDKITNESMYLSQVRQYNDEIAWDSICYVSEVLHQVKQRIDEDSEDFLMQNVLASLSATLCLVPGTIPVLSARMALVMLPHLNRCLSDVCERNTVAGSYTGEMLEGTWVIKVSGSIMLSDIEEYTVDFKRSSNDTEGLVAYEGKGLKTCGRAKYTNVVVDACLNGFLLNFVEEWSESMEQSSDSISRGEYASCVVTARLSLDGKRFEGSVRNVHNGTVGQIFGSHQQSIAAREANPRNTWSLCETLLLSAHSHLATMLVADISYDLGRPLTFSSNARGVQNPDTSNTLWIDEFLSRSLPSRLSMKEKQQSLDKEISLLKSIYKPSGNKFEINGINIYTMIDSTAKSLRRQEISDAESHLKSVTAIDSWMSALSGGKGSLRLLCPEQFDDCRRSIIASFVSLVDMSEELLSSVKSPTSSPNDDLIEMWRVSLKIMEDGLRKSLAQSGGPTKKECALRLCTLYRAIASLIADLTFEKPTIGGTEVSALLSDVSRLFVSIENETQIACLRKQLLSATNRGFLRLCSFESTADILLNYNLFNSAAIESVIVGIPRLFGKGNVPSTLITKSANNIDGMCSHLVDLEGNYLAGLQGCFTSIRSELRNTTISVYCRLVEYAKTLLAERDKDQCILKSNIDSTILSILATFVLNLRLEDCDTILNHSDIMSFMQNIFSSYMQSAIQTPACETQSVCRTKVLNSLVQRDIDRVIIKCAIAVVHVIMYQFSMCLIIDSNLHTNTREIVSLFEMGLRNSVLIVEESSSVQSDSMNRKARELEWQRWLNIVVPARSTDSRDKGEEKTILSVAGLDYFRRHGTLNPLYAVGSNGKQSLSAKGTTHGSSYRSGAEYGSGGFGHQCLSHWLHVLGVVLRSSKLVEDIVDKESWKSFFLGVVGLTIPPNAQISSKALPARFRARILRLMYPLMIQYDGSSAISRGLFRLCGESSLVATQSSDPDIANVSREANSLLRHLHSPSNLSWRVAVTQALQSILSSDENLEETYFEKVGALSFISGTIDTINRGSYVLLKPPASSALSSDSQQASSSKSHPGGVGGSTQSAPAFGTTPHHIAGNGTEAIITGLCQETSSAGIVSNVDLKGGICEVILVVRDKHQISYVADASTQNAKGSGRHSLTVRALRTPLSSVVLAPEVPLYLGNSLPIEKFSVTMLQSSLQSLLSLQTCARFQSDTSAEINSPTSDNKSTDDSDEQRHRAIKYATDLMVLRCAIVALSDTKMLSTFIEVPSSKTIFADILRMSCPDTYGGDLLSVAIARNKGIATLPVHEARLNHLVVLLSELRHRRGLIESCIESDSIKWQIKDIANERTGSLAVTDGESSESGIVRASTANPRSSGAATDSNRESEISSRRTISQSTGGSISDEEDDTEAANTAAAHLREAAIAQMAELGLPRPWAELALRRTGGIDIEAAVTFCLERGEEIERLLSEERERDHQMQSDSASGSSRRQGDGGASNHLLRQLLEMGFPRHWCSEALVVTGNNVDEALTWILSNGERLGEVDEAIEVGASTEGDDAEDDSAEGEDDDDETEVADESDKSSPQVEADTIVSEVVPKSTSIDDTVGWSGSITPLCFISGRAQVDSRRMEISGLPSGGFSSVGTKGILLTSGKWYYEAILETAGCLQIGWADGSFAGHCHADRGDGCGDGPSSWAYDGWRRYRWHATATEWGCRWKEGDIVGCMVDMDDHVVSFTLNGQGDSVGMGVAFSSEGFRPCGGVYACVSFNRSEKLRLILGGTKSEPFKYGPPTGFQGVGEAVAAAIQEYDTLIEKEKILCSKTCATQASIDEPKRFLCDFSDGEHGHELMAWAHRYYGSDASVHLGSGRMKHSSFRGTSLSPSDMKSKACITRRLEKAWKSYCDSEHFVPTSESSFDETRKIILKGYESTKKSINMDLLHECVLQATLLARKLLLHILIAQGKNFDLSIMLQGTNRASELENTLRFYRTIELCTNLRVAGWVGEAGAMAIAAEALGLGISSNDQLQARSSGDKSGTVSVGDLDEGVILPVCGYSQLLTSVLISDIDDFDTSTFAPASAEAAIGGEGGSGILSFLRDGILSACRSSQMLRDVLVASVRRSVRLIAVVEYDGDDFESVGKYEKEEDEETTEKIVDDRSTGKHRPETATDTNLELLQDARLAAFLTGALLSWSVQSSTTDASELVGDLFEAWSFGLLSASLPWRMVCAFKVGGILNIQPAVFHKTLYAFPTLSKFFGRLRSSICRRLWAERAAAPVCSRYIQALLELVSSVTRAVRTGLPCPKSFSQLWDKIDVDAATPISIYDSSPLDQKEMWEAADGWVSSDSGWDVWTGSVEYLPVDWKPPAPCRLLRTQMDGGDGPPMLREGCFVIRGLDWEDRHKESENKSTDGKDIYEAEKQKRDSDKQKLEELNPADQSINVEGEEDGAATNPAQENDDDSAPDDTKESKNKKKKVKAPSPKMAVGTIVSVEAWNGVPAMGRRVKWHLTGIEDVYRYGGDGGRYDICHVEVNAKQTRIKKKHPLPESREQCASRHGFGGRKDYPVLLRIRRKGRKLSEEPDYEHEGVLEWPDFGAGSRVTCILHGDGAVTIKEGELLYGSKDSGWEPRFGQPYYKAGAVTVLTPTRMSSSENLAELDLKSSSLSRFEEILGSCSFDVDFLRNPLDGTRMRVTSEMRLYRGRNKQSRVEQHIPNPPVSALLRFDSCYKAPFLSLSKDGRTVSCTASEGRGTVFGAMGFTKGVHYWEVKVEQADIGSVYIGVAEKPIGSGSGSSFVFDTPPRLNRWHGWGFVNFRATYTSGAERVYGSHCHAGDTVGVLLDCDAGRISFFFDGLKYGEHILNDFGCAFENLSPFGFNVDGCGSGGAGQGAPSGFENGTSGRYPAQGTNRPRTLWPVVGLRNQGDRVTISSKWNTSYGVDGVSTLENIIAFDSVVQSYIPTETSPDVVSSKTKFPMWFMQEAYEEYLKWIDQQWTHTPSRGSGQYTYANLGLDLVLDSSPLACAVACAELGLEKVLLSGDRVRLLRSAGRILELAEEALILGAYQGRLYHRIVSQKSEGGSLTEGGGRAWCFDESEVVEELPLVSVDRTLGVKMQKTSRFTCLAPGGLKVVYENGAVVRSDIEIFDGSMNLGTIPVGKIIPRNDVLERRVNSCGVVRFRVRFEAIGVGWISARIRGGTEEAIVEAVGLGEKKCSDDAPSDVSIKTPLEVAETWFDTWSNIPENKLYPTPCDLDLRISSFADFAQLSNDGVFPGMNSVQSDSLLSSAVTAISNHCGDGDAVNCSYTDVASVFASHETADSLEPGQRWKIVASIIGQRSTSLPPLKAILSRIAILRALNRRARYALPWLSLRPCQEGSALFGGLAGYGTSVDRAGRTRNKGDDASWIQVPSIANRLRLARGIFFTNVKMEFLQSITDATTTPTSISHDEYELPHEIRTVRINRLKAGRVMTGEDVASKRKYSVFSQLQNQTRNWGGATLRRGYVAKGHGGQRRAFKVKLVGEGVNDYSGPYREVFTEAISEVVKYNEFGSGALGVLDPSPNQFGAVGENRDTFIFSLNGKCLPPVHSVANSSRPDDYLRRAVSSILVARDETSREVEEALVFFGRLVGTAYRHRIQLDLPLPLFSTWKSLAEESSSDADVIQELDYLAYRQLVSEKDVGHMPLLQWQQRMLNAFAEGLSNVLPIEILPLFSGEELRTVFCGNPEVDVDLLKQIVEYEGYVATDKVVEYFWQAIESMTNHERKQFLQFVWARNRLPVRVSDFESSFKILKDSTNVGNKSDQTLPTASTCFFSLTLPEYSSAEILREKLLFAINNVTTMETDFQTNEVEIADGYRAF